MTSRLPDCILANILSYISVVERISALYTVCKNGMMLHVHSSTVWRKVDFDLQRRLTSDIMDLFWTNIFIPGVEKLCRVNAVFYNRENYVQFRPMQENKRS